MIKKIKYAIMLSLVAGASSFGHQLSKEDINFSKQLILKKSINKKEIQKRIDRTNLVLKNFGARVYSQNAVNIQIDLMLLAMAVKTHNLIDTEDLQKKWSLFFKFKRSDKIIAAETALIDYMRNNSLAFYTFLSDYLKSIPLEVDDARVHSLRLQDCYYLAQLFLTSKVEACYANLYESQAIPQAIRQNAQLALLNHFYVSKENLSKIDSLIKMIIASPAISSDIKFGITTRRSIENINDKNAMSKAQYALTLFGPKGSDPEVIFRRLKAGIHLYKKDLKLARSELQSIDRRSKDIEGISKHNLANTELIRAFVAYKNKDDSVAMKSLKFANDSLSEVIFCTSNLYTRATLLSIYRLLPSSKEDAQLINNKATQDCAEFISKNEITTKRVTDLISLINILESSEAIDKSKIKPLYDSLSALLFPSSILLPVLQELMAKGSN